MTFNKYLRSLTIVFWGLFAGQSIFLFFIVFINFVGVQTLPYPEFEKILYVILLLFTILGFVAGKYLYQMRIKKITESKTFTAKLNLYREAIIFKLASMEGISMMGTVFLLITGNILFSVIPVIIIGVFFFYKPEKEKIIQVLEPTIDELKYISQPDLPIEEL